jgi:hypothetical protein
VLHATAHGGLDQGPRLDGVVEIVAERVGDRIRHHDLGREMRNSLDPVLFDQPGQQILVAHVADGERHAFGYGPAEPGREVIEHDHALAGIDELEHHVAADVTGSARDQHCHCVSLLQSEPAP